MVCRAGRSRQAVLTDNGGAYRSRVVRTLLLREQIHHKRTRPPYTPRTNGKVERMIQTLLREWAYVRPYPTSQRRTEWLARYLTTYNEVRCHSAINTYHPCFTWPLPCEQRPHH